MSYDAIARLAWKQAGGDRELAQAAFAAVGGDPDDLGYWLPTVWAQFAEQGGADVAAAIAPLLDLIDPTAVQPADNVEAIQTCQELLGTAETASFRAAVGATTLAGGYGGDAANDQLALLFNFLTANLPA